MMSPPTKSYFLLNEPVPGHRIFDLLGRAVYIEEDSLKHPTEAIIRPRLPSKGPDLKTLEPNLYPKHVQAQNAEVLLAKAHSESAKVSISKVLGLFYKHQKTNMKKVSIPAFRRITMEERNDNIETLLNNPEYNEPIIELFQKYPEARFGIIVSIISCFEMEVGNKRSEEREGGGHGTVPSEATGGAGSVTLEAQASDSTTVELSGTYQDEVIMACAYVEMRLKKPDNGWLFWKTHKPSPHDITFTSQAVHPITMTVSVPPTRMEGDQEPLLGGMVEEDDEIVVKAETPEPGGQEDDGLNFVLFA
ncbi:hypothetical protein CC86DRAFT_373439 [Ophiobolus disseminans]|uniref:Uncharacterized protein n=1 Tax=Ophiobolus disseminans TaxID=1469910 RepID=A0A6A6ZPT2_9PLEO|nr:hypothetical protein CC86DRAFT_373439 [Ophiobolus disseminans]